MYIYIYMCIHIFDLRVRSADVRVRRANVRVRGSDVRGAGFIRMVPWGSYLILPYQWIVYKII